MKRKIIITLFVTLTAIISHCIYDNDPLYIVGMFTGSMSTWVYDWVTE